MAVISLPPETEYVKSVLSTSKPTRVVEPDPSSSKLTASTAASNGASLTGVTVTVNICELENSPSVTVAVNDSLPLKS